MPWDAPSRTWPWPAVRTVRHPPARAPRVHRVVVAHGDREVVRDALAGAGMPVDVTHGGTGSALVVHLRGAPADLPTQGYDLRTARQADGVHAVVAGADDLGTWYGLRALAELVRRTGDGWEVPQVALRDWPALPWRGTVEGFYGPPWTHEDRLAHLRLAGRLRLTTYVYAPKDDPFHRERWRELYPAEELGRLAELVAAAAAQRVALVFAVSPGLTMRYCDDAELVALVAKAEQVRAVGVRHFALLFDDIPTELQHPEDLAVFGRAAGGSGAAHGQVCRRFARALDVLDHRDGPAWTSTTPRLVMCPTDYAGTSRSPYREQLARTLPPDVPVWWTGADIVVGAVTREDIDAAAAGYDHDVLLWDNFPVNDFDRSRLFLGPLLGRTGDVAGSRLRGISTNPMVEAAPSAIPVATVALWAWDPATYDPRIAARWALDVVAGAFAPVVAPLVDACRTWPPSAPRNPGLAALTGAALAGDGAARDRLRAELEALRAVEAGLDGVPVDLARLAEQLRPWAQAARDVADAGTAALDLLAASEGEDAETLAAAEERARTAVGRAERCYHDVLRDVVLPFAEEVIRRVAGEEPETDGPVALVVTGADPAPGDTSLDDALRARGLVVRTTAGRHPAELEIDPALVVVTRTAGREEALAAAARPVPVVTWAHLVALGVATHADVLMAQETIVLTPEGAALSPSFEPGPLTVHRGPGTVTWGRTGPDAAVLARTVAGEPAVAHYPPGSRLADGTTTTHGRTALFLGREGMSPWLMTQEGRTFVATVVDRVRAGSGTTVPGSPT